jgi:hypothetical protein
MYEKEKQAIIDEEAIAAVDVFKYRGRKPK